MSKLFVEEAVVKMLAVIVNKKYENVSDVTLLVLYYGIKLATTLLEVLECYSPIKPNKHTTTVIQSEVDLYTFPIRHEYIYLKVVGHNLYFMFA